MSLPTLYRSPEDYLASMIQRVQDLGSQLTDFNDGSVTRTFYEGLAVGVSEQSALVEQLRLDSYLATATGDALTLKALDYQVGRIAAVAAQGTVRITRTGTGMAAVTIPAGWAPLSTLPGPGSPAVAYVTTADAVFAAGTGTQTVDVTAAAVTAGASGNLAQAAGADTPVVPANPVNGFLSNGGFTLHGPFTGGADEETDDQLRARVPIEVAGRVKGRRESFLAAAIAIPGVGSAQVLGPGETRANATTVAAGNVELYYEGDVALLGAVSTAALAVTMLGQTLTVIQAASVPMTIAVTVYVNPGVDTAAIAAAARSQLAAVVAAGPVGGTVRYSAAIQALHAIDEVVAVAMPFAQFRMTSEAAGTAHDVDLLNGQAPTLPDANLTVTVTTL